MTKLCVFPKHKIITLNTKFQFENVGYVNLRLAGQHGITTYR